MSVNRVAPSFEETNRMERGHDFYPSPETWTQIPAVYETNSIPFEQKVLHLHYFLGSYDWWVAEVDHEHAEAFGYVRLHGDDANAEWGYIDLLELEALFQPGRIDRTNAPGQVRLMPRQLVERDLYWQPRQFFELGLSS